MGVLRPQHQLNCNPRVKAIVLFEGHIANAFAAIEDLQADLASILVLAAQLHNCDHALDDLAFDDGLFG